MIILVLLFLLCAHTVCADPVQYAVIAVLDKVTTKVELFYVRVGDTIDVRNRVKVHVPACDAPPESSFYQDHKKCFVEIYDNGLQGGESERIFSQWMFRDYPVIGALQHVRYDVWVFDCSAAEPKERRRLF